MIYSMTGFARVQREQAWGNLTWELRSVNHRYLDMMIRLPESFRQWEPCVRKTISQQIKRGKVECQLRFVPGEALPQPLTLNTPLVDELIQASHKVTEKLSDHNPLAVIDLLRWPDVLRSDTVDMTPMKQPILESLSDAVSALNNMRETEGSALAKTTLQRLESMEAEINVLKPELPQFLTQMREKISKRLSELSLEADPVRLEQEMVLAAQKADVMEEIDRLTTHINAVRELIKKGGGLGRKLDFLMQELNREANTLASKAIDTKVTKVAVELKVLIEQMREQIQNIE